MIKFAVCAIAFGDGMVHTYLHNTVLDTYSIGWVCVVTFRTLALALGEVVTYLQIHQPHEQSLMSIPPTAIEFINKFQQ